MQRITKHHMTIYGLSTADRQNQNSHEESLKRCAFIRANALLYP
jgi:hypothetical protein